MFIKSKSICPACPVFLWIEAFERGFTRVDSNLTGKLQIRLERPIRD
jgi:hypothetical protein